MSTFRLVLTVLAACSFGSYLGAVLKYGSQELTIRTHIAALICLCFAVWSLYNY